MKRLLFIFITAVCLFSLSACGEGGNSSMSVTTLSPAAASASASGSSADETRQAQVSQQASASPVPSGSSSIIAESSNAVSDKEKAAILDNLSSQLDGMLNDSQNLDDLDSSDLDTNNIN